MKKRVYCMVASIRHFLWPRSEPGPEVLPISDEEIAQVETTERELRAELVRAQTEAMRFIAESGKSR